MQSVLWFKDNTFLMNTIKKKKKQNTPQKKLMPTSLQGDIPEQMGKLLAGGL